MHIFHIGNTPRFGIPQAPFRRREAFQSQRLLGVRTACLPKPTANTTQQPTHSTHPLGAGAPEFSQSKAAEGSDLRPPHTFVPEPRRPPAGSARNPLDPTPPGTRGRRRGNTDKPPVSLKSRRKFWDSCFTACSLNNLMISRIVGNGGRRKVPSVLEEAMNPGLTVHVPRRTFLQGSSRDSRGRSLGELWPTSEPT